MTLRLVAQPRHTKRLAASALRASDSPAGVLTGPSAYGIASASSDSSSAWAVRQALNSSRNGDCAAIGLASAEFYRHVGLIT
jgi:hypothetical protein